MRIRIFSGCIVLMLGVPLSLPTWAQTVLYQRAEKNMTEEGKKEPFYAFFLSWVEEFEARFEKLYRDGSFGEDRTLAIRAAVCQTSEWHEGQCIGVYYGVWDGEDESAAGVDFEEAYHQVNPDLRLDPKTEAGKAVQALRAALLARPPR